MGTILTSQEVIPEYVLCACVRSCFLYNTHTARCFSKYQSKNSWFCFKQYERIDCLRECGNAAYHKRFYFWLPIMFHYEWTCEDCRGEDKDDHNNPARYNEHNNTGRKEHNHDPHKEHNHNDFHNGFDHSTQDCCKDEN